MNETNSPLTYRTASYLAEAERARTRYLNSYAVRLSRLPFSKPTELGWHGIFLMAINIVLTVALWRKVARATALVASQPAAQGRAPLP
jgi:hypothetical protein